jgi:hypothetical protein
MEDRTMSKSASNFSSENTGGSDPRTRAAKAVADEKARSAAVLREYELATAKGSSPDQVLARQHVAATFVDLHFPAETPSIRQARLAPIDYTQPLAVQNGRVVDIRNPKSSGFLGFGRKPAYLVSAAFTPNKPEDPIYVLEYFPRKS